jgi:hypothetical protein
LGKIVGWGLLIFGGIFLLLVPMMCATGDPEAAMGGVLIGLFFAAPGGLVIGLIRHHKKTTELRNHMLGFMWSHDAFTASELAQKLGKSETETERLIVGLSRRSQMPLLFHASDRRYYHPDRVKRKHAVVSRCQNCGAVLGNEIVFEGETRRCRYCNSAAASLPPPAS